MNDRSIRKVSNCYSKDYNIRTNPQLNDSKQDTIMSSTVRTRISGRSSKAPRKFGDSPNPKAIAALDTISRELRLGSPKKVGRPRKKKSTEDAIGGDDSGGIDRRGRSRYPNPGDEDSTGGEASDGREDEENGGGGGGDDPTDESEDESSDDESRALIERKIDPLLLDAFLTCGIRQVKVRIKFAMAFSTVTGIAVRAIGDGKSLMKSIDDFNKRQKYYEILDHETANKIKALGHICKDLYRTGETVLKPSTVTERSLTKAVGSMNHEDNVRRRMDSVAKPPKLSQSEPTWLEWKQDLFNYLRTQVNCYDVSLLYVLVDDDFKIETEADAMLVKVYKLREDVRFIDNFETDDNAVYEILHYCLHGGDYSSIVDGPKRSGRDVFETLATRCAGIQDKWEYRNQAVSLSQKLYYKDEHSLSFQEYTSQWQKIFHLYYLAGEELSEAMKVTWFMDKLKAEDGSTVSISKSAIYSNSEVYGEDLNKVIARLTVDITGNKANRKAANYNKHNVKKQKYNVSEVGAEEITSPSKPAKKPPGVDVSDPAKWFEKDEYAKLPLEWRKYCSHKRYEALQKKKQEKKGKNPANDANKKKFQRNRTKRDNKYIKEVLTKQTEELTEKLEQKISSITSSTNNSGANNSNRGGGSVSFISSIQTMERKISSIKQTDPTNVGESAALELDSHADTSVLGKNFTILDYTNTSCDVYGFTETAKISDVPIVSGATAWNDENGTTFILVVHHAIWMGSKLKHSLINPNQVRFNGIRVRDDPTKDGLGIHTKDNYIRMKMRGIVCYTNTRVPSAEELRDCDRIVLTSSDGWDPRNVSFKISALES